MNSRLRGIRTEPIKTSVRRRPVFVRIRFGAVAAASPAHAAGCGAGIDAGPANRPGVADQSSGGVNVPTADSSAAATRYIRSSAIVGAITWKPTGSPSDNPHGTEIAGPP